MKRVMRYWPLWVVGFYFVPIWVSVGYAVFYIPVKQGWPYFLLSLAMSAFGSAGALLWGYRVKEKIGGQGLSRNSSIDVAAYQGQLLALERELERERELFEEELERERALAEELSRERDELLRETQEKTEHLQGENERKQRYALQLENKIRDLSYEIKTLLQLADIDEQEREQILSLPVEKGNKEAPKIQEFAAPYRTSKSHEEGAAVREMSHTTPYQAASILHRCIDTAQKMTGSHYLGPRGNRMGEYGSQADTLDLRHLFDRLRIESGGVIFVFSRQEGKMIFVSEQVRERLGWSPEKFVQNFPFLMQEGYERWEQALVGVAKSKQEEVGLVLKSKTGEDRPVRCFLGIIPTGLFKGYVIGILF